jgi:Rrf2 family transcriptional regulator, cysteine metabolism repressor
MFTKSLYYGSTPAAGAAGGGRGAAERAAVRDDRPTMRLSMKGDYGVRAMLDLAERAGQGPIQSEAIARRQSISDAYLDQLLTLLRRAGLVRSVRGPRGGHELARAAGSITLMDVLSALEGDFLAIGPSGATTGGEANGAADLPTVRVQRELWGKVRATTEALLAGTTVQDLLERQRALTAPARYYI